jgi:hypothetical protein
MNQFCQHVDQAILEIKKWNKFDPEAVKYQDFMASFLPRVQILKEKNGMKEFSEYYDGLVRSICDSGPLTNTFSPTFEQIGNALDKWKRKG